MVPAVEEIDDDVTVSLPQYDQLHPQAPWCRPEVHALLGCSPTNAVSESFGWSDRLSPNDNLVGVCPKMPTSGIPKLQPWHTSKKEIIEKLIRVGVPWGPIFRQGNFPSTLPQLWEKRLVLLELASGKHTMISDDMRLYITPWTLIWLSLIWEEKTLQEGLFVGCLVYVP